MKKKTTKKKTSKGKRMNRNERCPGCGGVHADIDTSNPNGIILDFEEELRGGSNWQARAEYLTKMQTEGVKLLESDKENGLGDLVAGLTPWQRGFIQVLESEGDDERRRQMLREVSGDNAFNAMTTMDDIRHNLITAVLNKIIHAYGLKSVGDFQLEAAKGRKHKDISIDG
jgi:hypothetical protein